MSDSGTAVERVNILKAGFATVLVICVTVLIVTGSAASEAGFGLLGTIAGYVLANGVNARLGRPTAPLIEPRATPE